MCSRSELRLASVAGSWSGVLSAFWAASVPPLNSPASAPARAYSDATRRLLGETVPMLVPSEPRGLMKLFGRRAA